MNRSPGQPPATPAGPEDGGAMIEYTVIVAFVLVPMIYLIVLLASLQSAAFASTASAREAARVAVAEVTAGRPGPESSARAAAAMAGEDFGHDASVAELRCAGCDQPTPEGAVTATTEVTVELPGLDRIGVDGPSVLTFTATHTEPLDTYRETR